MDTERRRRVLTDDDLSALVKALDESGSFPSGVHREHHDFLTGWIEREKRRAERWEKIKAQVGGWGVIAILSGIGYAVWEWAKNHIR